MVRVKLRLATSRMESTSSTGSARCIAEGARKVKKNVGSAFMAVFGRVLTRLDENFQLFWLELKYTLKRVLTQVDIESQPAVLRIQTELECNNCEALQNFATCRAMLHIGVAEDRRGLPDMIFSGALFDADIAVTEPGLTECAESYQESKDGFGTGGYKDQK